MTPAELAARLLARDRGAVSVALNWIEDQRAEARSAALELLEALEGKTEAALRVGITGAPGAGKSSLIDMLVQLLRKQDRSVGIIAVDPSSQRSGGALLGDRLRLRSGSGDAGVFLRSMAARDHLGGLAGSTASGVAILAAAFDVVLVETVGVGQSESEVSNLVDTLIFVAQPAAGDTVQFMKAGILEMPDIFVVNKADLGPAAERTLHELRGALGLGSGSSRVAPESESEVGAWHPVSILASAQDRVGGPQLIDAIDAHRDYLNGNREEPSMGDAAGKTGGETRLMERRRHGRCAYVLSALQRRYGVFGIEKSGGRNALIERIRSHSGDSFASLLHTIGSEIETRLRSA